MDCMPSNIDLYFALNENERNIVIIAAKAGDTPMTRQLLQLYFPKLAPQDIIALIKDLRGVAT